MKRLAINALHTFPSACARRAAIAAGEVVSGAVPAHLQDGIPDADGVLVDEVLVDYRSISIRTVQVAPEREPDARPWLWIRIEYDDVVEFTGQQGGWCYSYDQYETPQLTVSRDDQYPDSEPVERDFVQAVSAWAQSFGIEQSLASHGTEAGASGVR